MPRQILLLLAGLLLFYHTALVVRFLHSNQFVDFAHYYLYARNVVTGRALYDLNSPAAEAQHLGIRYADSPPNYPPPFYLGMSLFAILPYRIASVTWLLLNELLLLSALLWRGAARLRHNPVRLATLGIIVLAFQPLYSTLALGQANILLLAGLALTLRLWKLGSAWCGVCLGFVALIKPQFALLGGLWLRQHDRRHLGVTAITLLAVSLGTTALLGLDAWRGYVTYLRNFPCAISAWSHNISLRGILFRLRGACTTDGFGDSLALVATGLGILVIAVVLFSLPRETRSWSVSPWGPASLLLCAALLCSPYTQEHHLLVLLLAFTGLALDHRRPTRVIGQGAWLAAYALLATPYFLGFFSALGVALLGVLLTRGSEKGTYTGVSLSPSLAVLAVGVRLMPHALKAIFPIPTPLIDPVVLCSAILMWGILFILLIQYHHASELRRG